MLWKRSVKNSNDFFCLFCEVTTAQCLKLKLKKSSPQKAAGGV